METILNQLALDIQRKWGVQALQPASQLIRQYHTLSTGIPALNTALGGGIPSATLSHLEGSLTSGKTTLALKIVSQQPLAIYLDVSCSFDPDYASHLGVELDTLLLVRPENAETAFRIAQAVITRHDPPVVILDMGLTRLTPRLVKMLAQLMTHLPRYRCVLILLTEPTRYQLNAPVHLHCQHQGWLAENGAVTGFTAQVHVQHQLHGLDGQCIPLTIYLPETAL